MQITGEQRIQASRDKVWQALNDPDVLRRSIPGCESMEKRDDGFAAIIAVKIGPIGARFSGSVAIENPDPPQSYTLVGQGQGGMAGSAKGSARVELAEQGGETLLSYTVDAEVGGRLAQLGGPAIDATAKRLTAQFFANFEREMSGSPAQAQVVESGGAPAPAAPATVSASPWPWLVALAMAVIAGYFLGTSGVDYVWVIAVALLAIMCGAAGFAAGRGDPR